MRAPIWLRLFKKLNWITCWSWGPTDSQGLVVNPTCGCNFHTSFSVEFDNGIHFLSQLTRLCSNQKMRLSKLSFFNETRWRLKITNPHAKYAQLMHHFKPATFPTRFMQGTCTCKMLRCSPHQNLSTFVNCNPRTNTAKQPHARMAQLMCQILIETPCPTLIPLSHSKPTLSPPKCPSPCFLGRMLSLLKIQK